MNPKLKRARDRAKDAELELKRFQDEFLPGVEPRIRKAEEKAEQYKRDWYAAKAEFGTAMATQKEMFRSQLAMLCARLGGIVEGQPTSTLNYLQRVDELTRLEKVVKRLANALGAKACRQVPMCTSPSATKDPDKLCDPCFSRYLLFKQPVQVVCDGVPCGYGFGCGDTAYFNETPCTCSCHEKEAELAHHSV